MAKKKIDESKIKLFYPRGKKSLLRDYPELKKHKIFTEITSKELLFVWYYACESSPFYELDEPEEKIIERCVNIVYEDSLKAADLAQWKKGNFSPKMLSAIDVMKSFSVGFRARAKTLANKIMDNLEQIVDIDVSNENQFADKDGKVDWSKKKAYIDAAKTVATTLPALMSQVEGGYGITEIKEDGSIEEFDGSFMDDFHDQNS